MIDLSNIDALLFDMGGVLVDLDTDRCFDALSALGLNTGMDVNQLSVAGVDSRSSRFHVVFHDYQKGKVTTSQFLSFAHTCCREGVSDKQILESWNSMLVAFPEKRMDMLKHLRRTKKVYMLSNINDAHWEYVKSVFMNRDGYRPQDCFDHVFLSFAMGLEKPDREIFDAAVREVGLVPERTLYLDDMPDNIAIGNRLGFRTRLVDNSVQEWTELFR